MACFNNQLVFPTFAHSIISSKHHSKWTGYRNALKISQNLKHWP